MEKKSKLEGILAGAGKTAKNLLENAIQAVDQNDDGKFDLGDVAVIAGTVGDAAKKGAQAVRDSAAEKARALELKTLQPVFAARLDDADFLMPKFIRVAERDKKHAESEVCQGSIGYTSDQKGLHIVNIFRDSIQAFGVTFYPDCDYEFYYVDPGDRDHYIALDEYFNYLKVVRVNELKKIAQDLGAKRFRVTLQEERTSFSDKKGKSHIKSGGVASADAEHHATEKKYSMIRIEAESEFPGHAPIKPQLKYWQRDPNIQTLVSMRMDENSPLTHEKYVLNLSSSSGIKVNDAMKIDAVLKWLKCSGNTTVENEARNESIRYLEYDIEF